jgi:pimeloyl-ACP methyl ester carboxylesterase
MEFSSNSISSDNYKVGLREVKDSNAKDDIIVIGKRNYKIEGDAKAIAAFKDQTQLLSSHTFDKLIDFEASLKKDCNLTTKVKEVSEFIHPHLPPTTDSIKLGAHAILQTNGSTQAILKEVKKMEAAGVSFETMLKIAAQLAESGHTIRASHFFFHIQLNLDPQTREKAMGEMGKAFLTYGVENHDPVSLDFALMHILTKNEINLAKQQLRQILKKSQDPLIKAQAELALKRVAIFDALNPIPGTINIHELENLKTHQPSVKDAFNVAQEIQDSIDKGENPVSKPPGKIVDIIDEQKNTISLHVKLKGQRVHEKDPVVIFEAGLGCFSGDWQLVQDSLPEKEMLTLSYDRAGMGWSGPGNAEPTVERTLENLETLLKKLDLKPPYLFVGHSYGGIVGQMFTLKHPEFVKGLILVDSGLEHVRPSLGESPEPENKKATFYLPPAVTDFVSNPGVHSVGDEMALKMHYAASKTLDHHTMHAELSHFMPAGQSLLKVLNESSDKHPIKCPLKVIIAGRYPDMEDRKLSETEEKAKETWMTGQHNLLNRGVDSEPILAIESDHYIPYHQPELISEQIHALFHRV